MTRDEFRVFIETVMRLPKGERGEYLSRLPKDEIETFEGYLNEWKESLEEALKLVEAEGERLRDSLAQAAGTAGLYPEHQGEA